MVDIIKRKKALSVNPLKASQPIGGALATLGFNSAMPMLHGSQGCTAFAKVFFVRHFREPIPLQTTAMDQGSSVMGADDNIVEGLKNIADKSKPALIAILTTGLAETQGADVKGSVVVFRKKYPEHADVAVVSVNTPDFTGSAESGYALTVTEIIKQLVPEAEAAGTYAGKRKRQVNVLVNSMLTPGDIEALESLIEQFGLRPLFIPDISKSLDGALTEEQFSSVTIGGTRVSEMATLGDAKATLVIGPSMFKAAEILQQKTAVATYQFNHLYGLAANDAFISALIEISGHQVPSKVERQRMQLQDAMLDTHFMLGQLRVGIASDPDQLLALTDLLQEMGAEVVAAVASSQAAGLLEIALTEVKVGDLEDLQTIATEKKAQLLIGNSHVTATAERLSVPILKAGFPQYDVVGGYQKTWVGYNGAKQVLFDLANLVLNFSHEDIPVFHSMYSQKPFNEEKKSCH